MRRHDYLQSFLGVPPLAVTTFLRSQTKPVLYEEAFDLTRGHSANTIAHSECYLPGDRASRKLNRVRLEVKLYGLANVFHRFFFGQASGGATG
jgi:hypothetical protein